MTLPCQRTSSGSVKLPVQAAPLWAAAGPTQAEAASNPRATITKIRVRFVFMVKILSKTRFPFDPLRSAPGRHTIRRAFDGPRGRRCAYDSRLPMEAFEGGEDSVEFGRTERASDFSTSERMLSGRIAGLSVRIVFHEIRGNDPRYAFAFFFSATRKSRLRMSRCK